MAAMSMRALTMLFMKNVTNFIDDMHSHHLAAFAVRAANAVISNSIYASAA
jgi:hypothetical protein